MEPALQAKQPSLFFSSSSFLLTIVPPERTLVGLGAGGRGLTAKKSKSSGQQLGGWGGGHVSAHTAKRCKSALSCFLALPPCEPGLLIHHCRTDGRLQVRVFRERLSKVESGRVNPMYITWKTAAEGLHASSNTNRTHCGSN